MAGVLSISEIIQIAEYSQVLANVVNDKNTIFKSATLDPLLQQKIYRVRRNVQLRFLASPLDSTLRGAAEWLLQLCGPLALSAKNTLDLLGPPFPVVTGPSNQTVNVGDNAVFSVSVVSDLPVTYQWFDSVGNPILGATSASYTFVNSQLSDSGKTFFVRVTSDAGSVVSQTASLTVTAALVGSFYQGTTDFSTQLLSAIDNVPYMGTFPITTGQPFTVTFPHLGAQEFIVVKYPIGELTKTNYENPPGGFDSAAIPGLAWDTTTVGSFKYVFSRQGNPFALNNLNGQIKYS